MKMQSNLWVSNAWNGSSVHEHQQRAAGMSFSSETLRRGSDVENKENQSALLVDALLIFSPACLCISYFQAVTCEHQTALKHGL